MDLTVVGEYARLREGELACLALVGEGAGVEGGWIVCRGGGAGLGVGTLGPSYVSPTATSMCGVEDEVLDEHFGCRLGWERGRMNGFFIHAAADIRFDSLLVGEVLDCAEGLIDARKIEGVAFEDSSAGSSSEKSSAALSISRATF